MSSVIREGAAASQPLLAVGRSPARPTLAAKRPIGKRRLAATRTMLAAMWVTALVWLVPTVALAHPLIDEGKRKYDEADFQGALDAFTRAEQATDLSREDLVQLYIRRAMVHHAMQHPEDLEADVFRLATLDRGLTLPRSAPPPVRRAYEAAVARVTAPIRLDVEVQPMPGGIKLIARVTDDNAALVQSLRVRARTQDGSWRTSDRASMEVPAAAGATVEYVAEAIGPGGAVIATAGTVAEPLTATAGAAIGPGPDPGEGAGSLSGPRPGPGREPGGGGGGSSLPWALGIGGGVVVVAVVIVLIVVLSPSGTNQSTGAMVTF